MFGIYHSHTIGKKKNKIIIKAISLLLVLFLFIALLNFLGCNMHNNGLEIGHTRNTDVYYITPTVRIDDKLGIDRTDDEIIVIDNNEINEFNVIYTGKFNKFYYNSDYLAVYSESNICLVNLKTNKFIEETSVDEFESKYDLNSFTEYIIRIN